MVEARSLHSLKTRPLPAIYLTAVSLEHLPMPGPAFPALTDRQTTAGVRKLNRTI